jgi:hypothetical protein
VRAPVPIVLDATDFNLGGMDIDPIVGKELWLIDD